MRVAPWEKGAKIGPRYHRKLDGSTAKRRRKESCKMHDLSLRSACDAPPIPTLVSLPQEGLSPLAV